MNKKLYFNLVFFIMGTFVVLTMGTIIGMNFVKDSRLLAKPVIAQNIPESTPQPTPMKAKKNETNQTEGSNGTFVYKRDPIPVTTPKPAASPTPAPDLPDRKPIDSNTPKPATPDPSATPEGTPDSTAKPDVTPTPGATGTPGSTNPPENSGTPKPEASPKDVVTERVKVEVVNRTADKNLAEKVRKKLEDAGFEVSAGNDPSIGNVRTEIIIKKDNPEAQKIKNFINASKTSIQIDANSKYDVSVIIGDDYK